MKSTTTPNTINPNLADIVAQAIGDLDRLHQTLEVLEGSEFIQDHEHIREYIGAYSCLRSQLNEIHSQVLIGDLHHGHGVKVRAALDAWRDSIAPVAGSIEAANALTG